MRPDIGVTVAGRYRLESPLAVGGMGSVWVATHVGLDARVAVKFMSDEVALAPTGRARFEREAKAAARLTSPHVVRATDYGVEDNTPFIVMELLNGESLEARLRRETRLTPEDTAKIVRQVSKGLAEAHGLGIIHRDLKPANIFLACVGDEEIAKVLDFGIAKETNKALVVDDDTKSGTLLGSPQHMSPEQARGADVDARSDLWSLGVVAFRSLTGHRPFAGTNMADVVAKICIDPIPKPSALMPELGARFDAFFQKAFSRNPAFRFQSARELADAFAEATGVKDDSMVISVVRPLVSAEVAPRAESTAAFLARASSVDTVELTHTGTTRDGPPPEVTQTKDRRAPLAIGAALAGILLGGVMYLVFRTPSAPATEESAAAGAPASTVGSGASSPEVTPITSAAASSSAAVEVSASASAPASAASTVRRPPAAAGRPSSQVQPKRSSDPFF
ncbi:MAG: serine/threonine protein kinase [Myxococcales bacterium]|nr:serine/threonine protein kinase [Myxococcales bacterium]